MNRALEELNKWVGCTRLTLNLKKTEYVYFGKGPGPGGREVPPGGLEIGGE